MAEYDPEKIPFDTGAENPGYDGDETGENIELKKYPTTSSRRDSEYEVNPRRHRTY